MCVDQTAEVQGHTALLLFKVIGERCNCSAWSKGMSREGITWADILVRIRNHKEVCNQAEHTSSYSISTDLIHEPFGFAEAVGH